MAYLATKVEWKGKEDMVNVSFFNFFLVNSFKALSSSGWTNPLVHPVVRWHSQWALSHRHLRRWFGELEMWKVINVNTVERSQDFQDTITLQNSWVRHECEEVLFNSLWRNSKLQTLFVANICLILSSAFAERSWVRIPFQPPESFFRLYFHNWLSCVCDCDDYFCLCIFLRSSNAVSLHT